MEVIREQIARPCSGVAAEQEVRKEVRWFLCRSYLLKLRRDEDRGHGISSRQFDNKLSDARLDTRAALNAHAGAGGTCASCDACIITGYVYSMKLRHSSGRRTHVVVI